MRVFLLNCAIISVGHLVVTRNWCSLGASFGGSFSHTRLDRVSVLLLAKYRYHSISPHCCTVSLSEEMAVLLLDGA